MMRSSSRHVLALGRLPVELETSSTALRECRPSLLLKTIFIVIIILYLDIGFLYSLVLSICVATRVNKFGDFYRDSSKFDGFGPHQISKSAILLFTDSKYLKKICKKLE
jgi:hypothetical protein